MLVYIVSARIADASLIVIGLSRFFTQLIYLNDESLYTIPLALRTFLDSTRNSAYGQLFAMSVLSLLPVIAFFLLFQRMLIEGAATTGLKG